MRRRDFVILLGGGILVWTQRVSAQQPGKLPIIGYMGQGTPAAEAKRVSAFVERLRELSWIERTVLIEYRWTEGRSDLAADIAAEFVRRKVDVIVTAGTPLILAAKQVDLQRSRSYFQWRAIRSAAGWSRAWRDQAGMSPGCLSYPLILHANGSVCCASLFLGCAAWRSWETLAIR